MRWHGVSGLEVGVRVWCGRGKRSLVEESAGGAPRRILIARQICKNRPKKIEGK